MMLLQSIHSESFEGVSDQISAASRWSLSDTNSIYNNNSNGVIINKNNTSPVTTLESITIFM